jgi:hypothetical protein
MVTRSDECRVLIYPLYMWRRKWGLALACAEEAGLRVREIVEPTEAEGCQALLVLGDDLSPTEAEMARATGLPIVLTPGADAARQRLPEATMLPTARAEQVTTWQDLLAGQP